MSWKRNLAVVAALVLVLSACGDDDNGVGETGTTPTTAPEEAAEVTELAVTAADYSFDLGGPPPLLEPGLVRVSLTNQGAEEHQATLVRLHDGVDLAQFAAEATGDPTGAAALGLVDGFGGPNSAAPGGGTSTSTQNLVSGDYLMICFIPSPGDGVPHAAKGMVLPFTVEGDDGPAALPGDELAGELGLTEFAFDVPDDFAGQGTYAVANDGEQTHEVAVYRLADGATVDEAVAALIEATGPPPITPVAGLAAVGGQRSVDAYIELALEPGEYALLCFLPDVGGDGAPHFALGMAQQVTVS